MARRKRARRRQHARARHSVATAAIEAERDRARPHGRMRSLRCALPSSLGNGSIMRQANIRDARMEHAHVTGMGGKAKLTAKLRLR